MDTNEIPWRAVELLKWGFNKAQRAEDFESCVEYLQALQIIYSTQESKKSWLDQEKSKDE